MYPTVPNKNIGRMVKINDKITKFRYFQFYCESIKDQHKAMKLFEGKVGTIVAVRKASPHWLVEVPHEDRTIKSWIGVHNLTFLD